MPDVLQVLYVEDDPDIRMVTAFALEDEGFELIECDSGIDALSKAVNVTPALILLDVMMPGLDGPATLQQLREMPHLANTPVIFMTAKVQPAEKEQYMALGALGVLSKPFDPLALADDIRSLLSRSDG
ncbi:MAG: response regulator [Pseudohongiella sp.]|nr:response regulator [Pseudohongiella sp.]